MMEDFNYQLVPQLYSHCFHATCEKRAQCLRHWAAEKCASKEDTLTIINPYSIPEDTTSCPFFRSIQKKRMPWGVKNILNKVPYPIAKSIRHKIIAYYGRSSYYRVFRHERPVLPKEEAYITSIFQQNGIMEEPEFDKYTYEYDF